MLSGQKLQIVDFLSTINGASTHTISARLGISRQATHRHLKNLVENNYITKKGSSPKTTYMKNDNAPQSTHIVKQDYAITKEERRTKNAQRSSIIWFTGLSGSGKSTLANAVERRLFELGKNTYVLDGDNVRHGLNKDLTFSAKDRAENIRRIGEVAHLMVDSGLLVLTAFISPYISDRNMVRSLVGKDEFIEVFVSCPLKVCEERDVKGLYEKARKGQIKNFTGIDAPYEAPETPEIVVETDKNSIEDCVDQIVNYMLEKEYITGVKS